MGTVTALRVAGDMIQLWDETYWTVDEWVDGLPAWEWGHAPRGLATRSQLRDLPQPKSIGPQDPYGLLVFRHRKAARRREIAQLYRIDLARDRRAVTPAVLASVEKAMLARRTCRRCGQVQPRCVSTLTRTCWPCMEITGDFGQREQHAA
ncbi:hypothetical protein SAMN05421630_11525 [Prauserella marina]|uniref:Uncharacterized protein n=1 Tax=Prauserella marina TaxID=530584 RepID=A0A1G6YZ15_9PSEU|nr:RRQRL motif-containing zinc-binding protein [Prauserella marina]PWV71371.1 hypothetical protein DES30_11287 [Prauserella marina]SDD95588.1 hypothetical protein SAMN05421630_11525 [Prauserella marina]